MTRPAEEPNDLPSTVPPAEPSKKVPVEQWAISLTASAWATALPCATPPALTPVPAVPAVAGYEILGELGRGAMGVVYKARQTSLNRLVALKMILLGEHAGPSELARFRLEGEVLATLRHPNIVQIYEVGAWEGRPFITLELIDGGSLAERIRQELPSPEAATALIEVLARAVHSAHDKGIIHRDLKPANVLLTAEGTPKVTDFGLAKHISAGTDQTASGALLGTPSYMAPEQAGGKSNTAGPAADVWALGAILYQLLTGQPPFRGETTLDTLTRVLTEEPVPPRRLRSGLPRDLETICLKCLSKEPHQRYADARSLADDLHHFLAHEPIHARRVGPGERLLKWTRRRPALAAVHALLVLVTLLGTLGVGVIRLWLSAEEQKQVAEEKRTEAEQLKKKADGLLAEVEEARRLLAHESYLYLVQSAYRMSQKNNKAKAVNLLDNCPKDLRCWEWHYVNRLLHGDKPTVLGPRQSHRAKIESVAYSRNGELLASLDQEGEVKLWDARTGIEQFPRLKAGGQRSIAEGRKVTFSFTGTEVLLVGRGGQQVKAWNVFTGQEVKLRSFPVDPIVATQDGKRSVRPGLDNTVLVNDETRQQGALALMGHDARVTSAAFHPSGHLIVSGDWNGMIKVWDGTPRKERP